ncbi:hypothetical protein phiA047_0054 [Aeromonas phage phiA047]|nr:hypothetical protein phiA047_0054 [Aeromonas phage phiA047]
MEQQNNNKNKPVGKENLSKEAVLLSHEEVEYFKAVPTNLHVVYSKICNRVLIEKTDTVFTNEEEATTFAETLATTVSGLPLSFWEHSFNDIAVKYYIEDLEEIGLLHRITIYPKKL